MRALRLRPLRGLRSGQALLLAATLGAAGAVTPRPWSVQPRVARAEVRLGEPFLYEIEVRHPASESYALPPALALGPFSAENARCRRDAAGDAVTTTCAMTLALFDLGAHDVPPIALVARTPAGDGALEVIGPRVTAVGSADPDAPPERLALRDVGPPVPLLVPTWRPLVRAAWALGAVALVAAAVVAARRRRGRIAAAPEASPAEPPPPHAVLARTLDALEADPPPGRALAFRLSQAVRELAGTVVGLPALELTTAELGERLARAADPRVRAGEVVALLEELDLVKFAGEELGPLEAARAIQGARRIGERSATATATSTSTSTGTGSPNR